MMMKFKIRASASGSLMTDPKSKSEILSQSAKDVILRQWIKDNYHREKDIISKSIKKGLMNEEQGITMLSMYLNDMITKNNITLEDDYIKGTCDIIHDDIIYDIKCSYDIWTFAKASITKDYYWQLQCYMHLYQKNSAKLVYVLTDAPNSILESEIRSVIWKSDYNDIDAMQIQIDVTKTYTYDDIPLNDKIKIFEVQFDQSKINELIERVELSQEYYNNLKL